MKDIFELLMKLLFEYRFIGLLFKSFLKNLYFLGNIPLHNLPKKKYLMYGFFQFFTISYHSHKINHLQNIIFLPFFLIFDYMSIMSMN